MIRDIVSGCLFLLAVVLLAGCGSKAKVGDPPRTAAGSPAGSEDRAKLMKAVAEGDALWDAGEQGVKEAKKNKNVSAIQARKNFDQAFEKYMVVVNSQQGLSDRNVL